MSDAGESEGDGNPERPRPLVIACAVMGAEAVALLVLAVILIVKTSTQAAHDVAGALLLAGVALAGAAALGFGARGLLRLSPAARAPMVVIQLLAVPVSYSLAFQAGRVGYGGPIFVAAMAVVYLLFTPPVRAVLDRDITR